MRNMICAAAVVLVLCSTAFAALTPCPTDTLANYVADFTTAANGCYVLDKEFYGFTDVLQAGGTASTGGVGILVSPLPVPLNPGLEYSLAGFSVGSNQSLDLKLGFDVAVIGGSHVIEDASLGIAGAQNSGTGSVTIGENVCAGGTFSNPGAGTGCPGGDQNLSLNVQNPGPPQVFYDMKFTSPTPACPGGLCNLVGVFKDVSVTGGSAGSASLSSFTQQFSEVPEPASVMLLGGALLTIAGSIRRMARRA